GGPKPEPLGQPAEAPIASGQAQGLAAGSDAGGNRGGPGRPTNQAGNPRLERAAAPHGRMRGVFAQKARHQSVSIVNSMSETRWSFLTLPRKVQPEVEAEKLSPADQVRFPPLGTVGRHEPRAHTLH